MSLVRLPATAGFCVPVASRSLARISDLSNPGASPQSGEPASDGLAQRFRSDFDGVMHTAKVLTRYAADFCGHPVKNIMSVFSSPTRCDGR
jgi:hypothetical protein